MSKINTACIRSAHIQNGRSFETLGGGPNSKRSRPKRIPAKTAVVATAGNFVGGIGFVTLAHIAQVVGAEE